VVKEIDVQALQARRAEGDDFLLLDIRGGGELSHGMLPDAQHIPMHLIPARIHDLPRDRDVVLYCHSGARSYHACSYLKQQGFDNAVNLRGGILAWARSGYPLEGRQVG